MSIEKIKQKSERVLDWIFLLLTVSWASLPILIVIVSSFKLEKDIFTFAPKIIFSPVIKNYVELFTQWSRFFLSILNSALVAFGSMILVLLVCLPAAYSFSRFHFKGRSLSSFFLVAIRMFPPIIITVPLFPLFKQIGLLDTPFALILIYTTFQISLSTLLLKTFIDGVPRELEEQALIDGCTRFSSFIRVLMPNILPGIVAASIFVVVFAWNDFVFSFLLTGTRTKTAPIFIHEMLGAIGETDLSWGTVFAASTIQLLPVLGFTWFSQRGMIKGSLGGAVKQ